MDSLNEILSYHEATKHHPQRMARSLGYLDWATQPDPFRRYEGVETISLEWAAPKSAPLYDDLFRVGAIIATPPSSESLSEFFQYALALSAWKEFQGSRWALRINPSSGNLHPTEGYLVCGAIEGLIAHPGVFHYAPKEHALERRCRISTDSWEQVTAEFPPGTFFAGVTSIHWREAWKYGERAFRYCQHDVGHALAALSLSAALQGWSAVPLSAVTDEQTAAVLGLDRTDDYGSAEREHPDVLIAICTQGPHHIQKLPRDLNGDAIATFRKAPWFGSANKLSADHVEWPRIELAAQASTKSVPSLGQCAKACGAFPEDQIQERRDVSAPQIIMQRRSAVAMDGRTRIGADQFFGMMDRVLPRFGAPPWNVLEPPAYVDLLLFVHRVEGVEPGLYCLARHAGRVSRLRGAMRNDFEWAIPHECPEGLPLYRLIAGDARRAAGQLSCGQDIASDGVFSLGMIADFQEALRTNGPWFYRHLFWETGVIGQVLYLEAEATGIRGTGIGCFFDDPVHELFGLRDSEFQSLYHFTVGGPVEDTRLTTLPPYPSARTQGDSLD